MFAVQPWSLDCGNEELGAVGVFASVGHAEPARAVVLQFEVLVREAVSIDALAFKRNKYLHNLKTAQDNNFMCDLWLCLSEQLLHLTLVTSMLPNLSGDILSSMNTEQHCRFKFAKYTLKLSSHNYKVTLVVTQLL